MYIIALITQGAEVVRSNFKLSRWQHIRSMWVAAVTPMRPTPMSDLESL